MKFKRTCTKSYARYGSFKPYIRADFNYKCVYCHRHESAFNSYREFEIDHIKPKGIARFSHLENEYSNLVYSCPHCNNIKTDSWPSDDPIKDGMGWLDPCAYDFDEHYQIVYDGNKLNISSSSLLGEWLIHNLGFNQNARVRNIEKWYSTVHKTKALVLKLHRLSKRDDIPEDVRRDAYKDCRAWLAELRSLSMPEPYVPFKRPG